MKVVYYVLYRNAPASLSIDLKLTGHPERSEGSRPPT